MTLKKTDKQYTLNDFTPKDNHKDESKFSFIDLFSGIGGFRLAFESIGGKCVFSSDIDKWANETYFMNFGEYPYGDITKIPENQIPNHDILCAGFPCQPFSIGGYRKGFCDTRGTLFFEIERILKAKKPKAFLLENVKGLTNHDKGNTFKVIKSMLEEFGYTVLFQVMNAKEYGNLPQQRNRIYIVAFRFKKNLAKFKYPEMIPLTRTAFDLYDKEKKEDKYYMDGHRMWDRMMEYMTERNRVYRFTDWGLSRSREGICPTLLAAMGSRFERIPFFYDDY